MEENTREIEKLKITFDVIKDEAKILVGHKKTSGYLVFDACMTLECKAHWVKYRHRTHEPE